MNLVNLIIIALFVEAVVQTIKPLWDKTAGTTIIKGGKSNGRLD
jgi:hypothetical protein